MTGVKVSCQACGEIVVDIKSIFLRIRHDKKVGTFEYICPGCGAKIYRQATPKIMTLLVQGGVKWRLAAPPRAPMDGPPVCHNDIIDFHFLLDEPDWFDRVAEMVE